MDLDMYEVEVIETRTKKVMVEASDVITAVQMVAQQYKDGEIDMDDAERKAKVRHKGINGNIVEFIEEK